MDLSASLRNVNREKRERQPNWTESEKQLLLCLTEMYKAVLENKSSDTMSIKRKSEAWDQIALRMKAAGFNRSKERLKQQLGRIRAAEAKRIKESMEMYLNNSQTEHSANKGDITQNQRPLQEPQYIKSENMQPVEVDDCNITEIKVNSSVLKPNFKTYTVVNAAGKENKNIENSKTHLDGMHFKLQSVQSLANSGKHFEIKCSSSLDEEKRMCADDVTSSISNGNLNVEPSTSFKSNQNNTCANDDDAISCLTTEKPQKQQRKIRSNLKRSQFNRQKSLEVLYKYRIAFERERLRNLKLQQKRDRILYRKDIDIQNLKLQILQNLKNQQYAAANNDTF